MKRFIPLLLVLLAASCSKKSEGNAGGGTAASGGNASDKAAHPPPAYVVAVAQNQPAENVVGTVDPFLTQQLQIFIQQKQRMPEDFAELARARLDSVPRPPPGKKWAIDRSTRQVKAVVE